MEAINKMKRQHTKWKKIFTNHISDKKSPKCINNSYNSMAPPQKKWAEGLN